MWRIGAFKIVEEITERHKKISLDLIAVKLLGNVSTHNFVSLTELIKR